MGSPADFVDRVLDATLAEVADRGLRALSVERVAARADTSRATLYRNFPGGRDDLVDRTLRREVARFQARVLEASSTAVGLAERVAATVLAARRGLATHAVLQQLLHDEADALLPSLATVHPLVLAGMRHHLRTELDAAAADGDLDAAAADGDLDADDLDAAADHLARMVLGYVGSSGTWDLDDEAEVAVLVREVLLAGLLVPPTEE